MITPFTINIHPHVYEKLPEPKVHRGEDGVGWLAWGDLNIFASKALLIEDLEKIAEILNAARERQS